MPLFTIGSCLGYVCGLTFGLPSHLCAALGYCCLFGAGTNTFFAPFFICIEAFGMEYLVFLIPVYILVYALDHKSSI